MVKDAPLPLAHIASKAPTALHENYAEWLREKTGYENIDVKSVQLATSLRMVFQRSEENQQDIANRKAAAEAKVAARVKSAEEREAARAKRDADRSERAANKGAKGGKATAKAAKATEAPAGSDDELDDEETTPVAPVKPRRSRAKKTAAPTAVEDSAADVTTDDEPVVETDF